MGTWSFSSQQATLRRLDKAFAAFFRRVKRGEDPDYPRFKAEHRFGSVEWPKDGDGCRWHPETSRIYLKGIGHVKVTGHRLVEGKVKTVAVKKQGQHWYLVLSCDKVPTKPLPETGRQTGIDLGIVSFLTTSDGEHVSNPRWARTGAERLAAAQRVLGRKKNGSKNRRAARQTVVSRHRKVANQRLDFHHKRARKLVTAYDLIVFEDPTSERWCGLEGPNLTRTILVSSCPTAPPPRRGSTVPSPTRAGLASCLSCVLKRKRLSAS
jgi:putative transposase